MYKHYEMEDCMTQEIELRIQTKKEELFLAWLEKNASFKSDILQIDYYLDRVEAPYFYFDSNNKLQSDYWLRIRSNNGFFMLCLKKVHRDENQNYLYSDEYETEISDLENTLKIYENLGYYKAITVNKQRKEWEYEDFIIAYDCIENLGSFFEIELKPSDISYDEGKNKIEKFLFSVLDGEYSPSKGGYPSLIYNLNQSKL